MVSEDKGGSIMENNKMQIWGYAGSDIRTMVDESKEAWWALVDVCEILELKNPSMVAGRLDDDEVTKFDLGSLEGETWFVNEAGLYSVILRSDKPEAKAFKRWVTHEVLPSIRKYGYYGKKPLSPKQEKLAAEKAESRAARDKIIQDHKDAMARRAEFDKKYPHTYSLLWSVCAVSDTDLIFKMIYKLASSRNKHLMARYDNNSDYQYTDLGVKVIAEAVWHEAGRGDYMVDALLNSRSYLLSSEKPILKKIWEEEQRGQDA
ncbi:MAG: BRO family protein [Petrimonas sp.]|nr:BRO family protein [Petrimonas sp.]